MFFLPADLAKEAGNEVLSHWMGNLGTNQDVSFTLGHVSQFSFLEGQCNSFFPPLSELLPRVYSGSVSTCFSGSFFAFFVDSNSVMLIKLSIKRCCIVEWKKKNAFSVWEEFNFIHASYHDSLVLQCHTFVHLKFYILLLISCREGQGTSL